MLFTWLVDWTGGWTNLDEKNLLHSLHRQEAVEFTMILFQLCLEKAEELSVGGNISQRILNDVNMMLCTMHASHKVQFSLGNG